VALPVAGGGEQLAALGPQPTPLPATSFKLQGRGVVGGFVTVP